ncbi:GTP-binding protein EngB [Rubellimicrobium mesophilum DSM 19309]|uniref:GTP-binding protein EngB n=1 Tax=Rubellimicrobium mesophilum DSM 19309 TaxID=442562 RepID=A0A017HSR8_9RHOB|nr:GTP-binding protein EngB [Rubellimicrobium mesophilum DSM 19309]
MTKLTFPEAPVPDEASLERGRLLFAGQVDFLKGVVAMSGLPPPTGPRSASPAAPTSASRASSTR